jgi:glucokinase
LAQRYRLLKPASAAEAPEVLALAGSGDSLAAQVVDSAGRALGAAIAHLVNVLDPEAVIIGGGLGLAGGPYRAALETGFRAHLWSPIHASVPILPAKLGADAGFVGAASASQIN